MPYSISAAGSPLSRLSIWHAFVAFLIAGFVILISANFGIQFVLRALLVQQASSTGMDWAYHIEARVPGLSKPSTRTGKPISLNAPETQAFADMVNGMFAVGNIYQIDVINPDCYCDISMGSFGTVNRATSKQFNPSYTQQANHQAAGSDRAKGHLHGAHNKTAALPQPVVRHIFESKSKHKPRSFGSNSRGRWPIDRVTARSIVKSGRRQIFLREAAADNQPRTFAEVYHPVSDNGELSYVLRILVDLEEHKARFLAALYRGAGLVLVLLICISGYPAFRYLRASKRQAIANDRARFLATHDILTNIANRNAFQERAPKILRACHASRQAAIIIQLDLNKFKEINDYYGHHAGDQLLRQFAQLLKSSLPEHAHVARLGGDEFAVIVGGLEPDTVGNFDVNAIPKNVSIICQHTEQHVATTVSGGSARFPHDGKTIDELMRSADLALYEAKSLATGGIREFDQKMSADFNARLELRGEFRKALANSEIEPFYQPLVNLETGRVVGFEALARWLHPEKGILTPYVFEKMLADRELGQMVGTLMFEKTVRDMKFWKSTGVPFESVGLNVGEGDLLQSTFALNIISTLSENGLVPGEFAVEVTETCMFGSNKADFIQQLKYLRAAGCSVALDDFGTGYSSITQIKELPCTAVKIDKSFVHDVESNDTDRAIIEALLSLGKSIGFKVVLEGVETEDQRDFLRSLGCVLAQGYYYARPVPAAEVPSLIERLNLGQEDYHDLSIRVA